MPLADRWSSLKESYGVTWDLPVTLATGSPLSFLHTYGWSSWCLLSLLPVENPCPSLPGSLCRQAVSGHFREVLSPSLAVSLLSLCLCFIG